MEYIELIKGEVCNLPLKQTTAKQFDKFIEDYLLQFLRKIQALENRTYDFDGLTIDSYFIKSTQEIIVTGLIEVIKEYYNGNPSNAYEKLNNILRNRIKDLYAIIPQRDYSIGENFYRIRVKGDNFPLSAADLFHIPFELRGKVSTQRFSIPGFPSLYLGRTLYVCWEELKRPQINHFQAVRLKNVKPLKILDLTPPAIHELNERSLEVYQFFMLFPLIACCSVKVKNPEDTFKPEYIIPQLLLQWVRNNDQIDGIKYKSTHLTSELYKQEGELSNVVIPVKNNQTKGHCKDSKSLFEMTEVVSWQLHEYALGGQTFMYNREELDSIDRKLPKLEFIKGITYPYSYSILGKLEYYLDRLPTKKI